MRNKVIKIWEMVKKMFQIQNLLSIIAIVLAVLSLSVSINEYEYKLSPKFEVTGSVMLADVLVNGVEKKIPLLRAFCVDTVAVNNLDDLYMVDPNFAVQKIDCKHISKSVQDYFSESIGDGGKPDFSDTVNDIYYYYRFLVIESLDGTTDVRVLYFKSRPIGFVESTGSFQFEEMDKVTMMEFEKSHQDDPMYEGERKIAKQYREITSYLSQFK